MFKLLKKIFYDNTWEILFPTSLFIKKDEATLDAFISQMNNAEKFKKWFNCFPFVWISIDNEYYDVGSTATFNFLFPPFSYKMTCVERKDKCHFTAAFSGPMRGEAHANFIEKEDGYLLDHPLRISGKNKFIHIYYWLFLKPPHLIYMRWRYSILKKNLINEALKGDEKN